MEDRLFEYSKDESDIEPPPIKKPRDYSINSTEVFELQKKLDLMFKVQQRLVAQLEHKENCCTELVDKLQLKVEKENQLVKENEELVAQLEQKENCCTELVNKLQLKVEKEKQLVKENEELVAQLQLWEEGKKKPVQASVSCPVERPNANEMEDFEELYAKYEAKYATLGVGALKVIPPDEWKNKHGCDFERSQLTLGKKRITPKIQLAQQLHQGICRLTNNPLTDRQHLPIANSDLLQHEKRDGITLKNFCNKILMSQQNAGLTSFTTEQLIEKCWQKLPTITQGSDYHHLGDYGMDLNWSALKFLANSETKQGANLGNLKSLLSEIGKRIPVIHNKKLINL